MDRVFYVLYIPNRELQNYLDLLRLVCEPSVTNPAHLTVRGPYGAKQGAERIWKMPSTVNVQVRSVGVFFSENQSTVFLRCDSEDLRRFWWKPHYKDFEPHITIYDGHSRQFAEQVCEVLRHHDISFNFAVQRLYAHDSANGQFSLALDWNEYRRILMDIGEGHLTVESIRQLNDHERIVILDKIAENFETYLQTRDAKNESNGIPSTALEEDTAAELTRNRIFISHANPEDNEFARWLTLRLISEGYPTWCDLVRLKGGEDFWKDIEEIIRQRCAKFIFVLSETSNIKEGPLQELAVAKAVARENELRDFIIPIHVDDLPYSKMNIEIKRLTAIPFDVSWAQGLRQLITKLEEDGIAKDNAYSPNAAASWWREQFSAYAGVVRRHENYLSSWFEVTTIPDQIYFHLLRTQRVESRNADAAKVPSYPVSSFGSGVFSFAKREDFEDSLVKGLFIPDSHRFFIKDLLAGKHSRTFVNARQARNAILHLLEQAWRRMVIQRGMAVHTMANRSWCSYFVKDQVKNDRLDFKNIDGASSRRYVMGYRTLRSRDDVTRLRHWHFGLSAKPMLDPILAFAIKGHVLFSDDGKQVWASPERLHRARMSQCRNWWNDDWRDRMLATMNWLASSFEVIQLPVGSDSLIEVASTPIHFESDVSYREPTVSLPPIDSSENEEAFDDEEVTIG